MQDSITVKREVVWVDGALRVLPTTQEVKQMKESATKSSDPAAKQATLDLVTRLEEERKSYGDRIRSVTVTMTVPTPALRTAAEAAAHRASEGYVTPQLVSLELLKRCIQEWDLTDANGKPVELSQESIEQMPIELFDVLAGEIYKTAYPSAVRLAFLMR